MAKTKKKDKEKLEIPKKFRSQAQIRYFWANADELTKKEVKQLREKTRGIEMDDYPKKDRRRKKKK